MTSTNSEEQTSATSEESNQDYEILCEEYPKYDVSFKIIVIGNSGN